MPAADYTVTGYANTDATTTIDFPFYTGMAPQPYVTAPEIQEQAAGGGSPKKPGGVQQWVEENANMLLAGGIGVMVLGILTAGRRR